MLEHQLATAEPLTTSEQRFCVRTDLSGEVDLQVLVTVLKQQVRVRLPKEPRQ